MGDGLIDNLVGFGMSAGVDWGGVVPLRVRSSRSFWRLVWWTVWLVLACQQRVRAYAIRES